MTRRPVAVLFAGGLMSLALIVSGVLSGDVSAANKVAKTTKKAMKKPIRNPKFDPKAEKVELFEAVDADQLTVKLVPKDAMGGTVFVENKTDKPLTVKVPEAVVGVPVLAQGFGGMGGGGMGMGGMGGMGMGGMGGMGGGGGQGMGGGMGGMGGMGGGGMGGMGMGGGMFSVPPESVVSIPFNSVCLEHGKPDPNPSAKYTLIPVAKFNPDPVLFQLLRAVGSGKVDPQAAQAAAWYLTDKMSFDQLAAKTIEPEGSLSATPYFSPEQLAGAQQLLSAAVARASEELSADQSEEKPADESPRSKSSRVRSN